MTRDEIAAVVRHVLEEERKRQETVSDTAVLKTVAGILTAFGINDDDRNEIRKDFAYLRRWRQTSEQVQRGWWIAIMALVVSGFSSMVYLAVKALFVTK